MFSRTPFTRLLHHRTSIVPYVSEGQGVESRRWVRETEESCVSAVRRVSDILPNYVVGYKFSDPTWRSLLTLPASNPAGLETRARHIAFELRYLSLFGQTVWVTTNTRHSVIHPYGLVQRSFVECTYEDGNRQRLLTYIRHEGIIDGRKGPDSERGLIAVSRVSNLSRSLDRMEMVIRRSRRVGSMSAGMSALNLKLFSPEFVGKSDINEVLLLEPHTRIVGGGVVARCIASSWNICRHPYLYTHNFEVPCTVGVDAFAQSIHYGAQTANKLVKGGEHLHALAWEVNTNFPYSPIEVELPFTTLVSRPTVYHPHHSFPNTLIGTPIVGGAPIQCYTGSIAIGFSQYAAHEMECPAERAYHWWSQKNEYPYHITMYVARTPHLPKLNLIDDTHTNPFAAGEGLNTHAERISKSRVRAAVQRRIQEVGEDPMADVDDEEMIVMDGDTKKNKKMISRRRKSEQMEVVEAPLQLNGDVTEEGLGFEKPLKLE